jgi:CheY-like chemotaxis protein
MVEATQARARVLLVEDDVRTGEMLCEFIRTFHCDATLVGSGPAAIAAYDREAYDLIITDYRLPGMHGLELARCLQERNPDVEMIMLTGMIAPGEDTAPPTMTILRKPLGLKALQEAVERALSRRAPSSRLPS